MWYVPSVALFMVAFLLLVAPDAHAQTAAPTPQPAPAYSGIRPLNDDMRRLFPSLPASLDEIQDVDAPRFRDAAGTEVIALGVVPNPNAATISVPPQTLKLTFSGGVRARLFTSPAWLTATPDALVNPKGTAVANVTLKAREDATQAAGFLPAQRNWGRLTLAMNGASFEYVLPLVVGAPPGFDAASAANRDRLYDLLRQVRDQLVRHGDRDLLIGTLDHPNATQFVLGLIVDDLAQNGGYLPAPDFATRVAETLAQKDYDGDGWQGFRPEDIIKGAPGWLLGTETKK